MGAGQSLEQHALEKNRSNQYQYVKELSLTPTGRFLGQGSFSLVYEAKTPKGQTVAVKAFNGRGELQILTELNILRGLKHANVVQIVGITSREGLKLVLEYMAEGTLSHYLQSDKGRKEDEEFRWNICRQVADGINYIHENNIIHRDLAARNVLLSSTMQAKVADFGFARMVNYTSSPSAYGCEDTKHIPIRWSPVECVSSLTETEEYGGHYSQFSDVWSFGVLVWEVYNDGVLPYTKQDHIALSREEVVREICWGSNPTNFPEAKQPRCAYPMCIQNMMTAISVEENQRPSMLQLTKIFHESVYKVGNLLTRLHAMESAENVLDVEENFNQDLKTPGDNNVPSRAHEKRPHPIFCGKGGHTDKLVNCPLPTRKRPQLCTSNLVRTILWNDAGESGMYLLRDESLNRVKELFPPLPSYVIVIICDKLDNVASLLQHIAQELGYGFDDDADFGFSSYKWRFWILQQALVYKNRPFLICVITDVLNSGTSSEEQLAILSISLLLANTAIVVLNSNDGEQLSSFGVLAEAVHMRNPTEVKQLQSLYILIDYPDEVTATYDVGWRILIGHPSFPTFENLTSTFQNIEGITERLEIHFVSRTRGLPKFFQHLHYLQYNLPCGKLCDMMIEHLQNLNQTSHSNQAWGISFPDYKYGMALQRTKLLLLRETREETWRSSALPTNSKLAEILATMRQNATDRFHKFSLPGTRGALKGKAILGVILSSHWETCLWETCFLNDALHVAEDSFRLHFDESILQLMEPWDDFIAYAKKARTAAKSSFKAFVGQRPSVLFNHTALFNHLIDGLLRKIFHYWSKRSSLEPMHFSSRVTKLLYSTWKGCHSDAHKTNQSEGMSFVPVHEIVTKLREDAFVINGYSQLAGGLGVPDSDYANIGKGFINETLSAYGHLKYIINLWLMNSQTGSKSHFSKKMKTVGQLCSILKSEGFIHSAEELMLSFASELIIYREASNSEESTSHLKQKWWPEEKALPATFVERRTITGTLVVEVLDGIMHQKAATATGISKQVCIYGLSGIGKTTLAKWYANHFSSRFDLIIWIDCAEKTLSSSIKYLRQCLFETVTSDIKLKTSGRDSKHFSNFQEYKTLVIYDNADEYAGTGGINHVLPSTKDFPNMTCIFTARTNLQGAKSMFGDITPWCLDQLSIEESLRLLHLSLENVDASSAELEQLAAKLSYSPLALQIAIAHLNLHYSSRLNGLGVYMEATSESYEKVSSSSSDLLNYNCWLLATIEQTELTLRGQADIGEMAWRMLCAMASLDPPIPLQFLIWLESTSYELGTSICNLLCNYSLIQLSGDPENYDVMIHRLLQETLMMFCRLQGPDQYPIGAAPDNTAIFPPDTMQDGTPNVAGWMGSASMKTLCDNEHMDIFGNNIPQTFGNLVSEDTSSSVNLTTIVNILMSDSGVREHWNQLADALSVPRADYMEVENQLKDGTGGIRLLLEHIILCWSRRGFKHGESATIAILWVALKNTHLTSAAGLIAKKFSPTATLATPKPCKLVAKWWPEEKPLINSFVERKVHGKYAVDTLHEMLNSTTSTAVISQRACISGLGGIGKTTLAKWYANTWAGDYDHVVWIDCGEDSMVESLNRLWDSLHDATEQKRPQNLLDIAQQCFRALRQCHSLFIYDNAEEYEGRHGVLSALPTADWSCSIHCLITSRWTAWGSKHGHHMIPQLAMDTFTLEESVLFLEHNLAKTLSPSKKELALLSELLGCLPLALQIALAHLNRYYRQPDQTITSYIEYLQKSYQTVVLQITNADGYNKAMYSIVSETKRKLLEEGLKGHLAWKLLYNMAYLRCDFVGVRFLANIEKAAQDVALKACELLTKHSLVSMTWPPKDSNIFPEDQHYVSMHRLLQKTIKYLNEPNAVLHCSKILGCTLSVNSDAWYKWETYVEARTFLNAVEYADFVTAQKQIYFEVPLSRLLTSKRYSDAVDLLNLYNDVTDNFDKYKLCPHQVEGSAGGFSRLMRSFGGCRKCRALQQKNRLVIKALQGYVWYMLRDYQLSLSLLGLSKEEAKKNTMFVDQRIGYKAFLEQTRQPPSNWEKLCWNGLCLWTAMANGRVHGNEVALESAKDICLNENGGLRLSHWNECGARLHDIIPNGCSYVELAKSCVCVLSAKSWLSVNQAKELAFYKVDRVKLTTDEDEEFCKEVNYHEAFPTKCFDLHINSDDKDCTNINFHLSKLWPQTRSFTLVKCSATWSMPSLELFQLNQLTLKRLRNPIPREFGFDKQFPMLRHISIDKMAVPIDMFPQSFDHLELNGVQILTTNLCVPNANTIDIRGYELTSDILSTLKCFSFQKLTLRLKGFGEGGNLPEECRCLSLILDMSEHTTIHGAWNRDAVAGIVGYGVSVCNNEEVKCFVGKTQRKMEDWIPYESVYFRNMTI